LLQNGRAWVQLSGSGNHVRLLFIVLYASDFSNAVTRAMVSRRSALAAASSALASIVHRPCR
jgi:hypothetical protein